MSMAGYYKIGKSKRIRTYRSPKKPKKLWGLFVNGKFDAETRIEFSVEPPAISWFLHDNAAPLGRYGGPLEELRLQVKEIEVKEAGVAKWQTHRT